MRSTITLALLAAAIGGPYLATREDLEIKFPTPLVWTQSAKDSVDQVTAWASATTASVTGNSDSAINAHQEVEELRRLEGDRFRYDDAIVDRLSGRTNGRMQPGGGGGASNGNTLISRRPPVAGRPIEDLRELLRFTWTQSELHARFASVATVLADTRLRGVRVPFVTGTRTDDLAGTLTLYFDASDRLQRLNVHGFTGDAARLRNVLSEHYGMAPEPNLEAGVMTRRWNGAPISLLRLTYAPVVHSDAVHQKLTVFLELNAPDLAYGISTEAARIVHSDRWTGRW